MYWLVAQDTQPDNAKEAGQGAAQMLSGAVDWLTGFANGPNGEWLGYLILIVLGLWLLRRMGVMRS